MQPLAAGAMTRFFSASFEPTGDYPSGRCDWQISRPKIATVKAFYQCFALPEQSLCYGLIVNVFAFDVPPPGVAFTTVTEAVPCVAMSAMEMEAVSFVLLANVVVRADPFQSTTEPETKFEPFTVSVKAGPPAVALLGEIELIAGTGLLMVNVCAFDVPPPGATFITVTEAVPAVLISDEGTAAVT